VCIALSTLDQKLFVFPYLEEALKEDTLIPQEELIRLVVQCNSRLIKRSMISGIMDLEELTSEAKHVLCELIQ
jgi:20S proteasome alpha/beta subunit